MSSDERHVLVAVVVVVEGRAFGRRIEDAEPDHRGHPLDGLRRPQFGTRPRMLLAARPNGSARCARRASSSDSRAADVTTYHGTRHACSCSVFSAHATRFYLLLANFFGDTSALSSV